MVKMVSLKRFILSSTVVAAVIIPALAGISGQALAVSPASTTSTTSSDTSSGLIVQRGSNGVPTSVTTTVHATEGWHVETTPEGQLQFVGPNNKVIDTWGTTLRSGSLTITGSFVKLDDTHIRFDISKVATQDRHVGFGKWLNCIGGRARDGAITGSIGGCIGSFWVAGVGCFVGGAVGGGTAAFGNTVAGLFGC